MKIACSEQRDLFRRDWRRAAFALLAALLVGCSSKNPDALTGMNVDENLAVMNASESVDPGIAGSELHSGTNATVIDGSVKGTDQSEETTATNARSRAAANREVSAEENAIATNEPGTFEGGNGPNQVEHNDDEVPNAI